MINNLFRIILFFISTLSIAQNQNNFWYFGNGAALNFNNGCVPFILTDGKMNGFEGCATISDRVSGRLLFYTNSDSVWNKNHYVMPNGHLITNGNTISQVLIIQKPAHSFLYYIITSEVQGFSGQGLRFHGIDMILNGYLGGLTFKDSVLYSSPVTEKLTAIRHANGTDVWLIGHEYGSNKFLSFLITSSGINTVPIVSKIGKVHYDASSVDAVGEIKASPNGKKLASVTLRQPDIELFDFNNSTGQISNLITLPENGGYDTLGNPSGLYGIAFSSNNSMLYASKWNLPSLGSPGQIMQFDITSNDSTTINNSRVDVFTSTSKSLYSLQLAPNRKIYVGQNVNNYIGVINSPDLAGLNCNYAENGIYLNGKQSSWGLNNCWEYGSYCSPTGIEEQNQDYDIHLFPNPSNGSFTIQTTSKVTGIEIFNVIGEVVYTAAPASPSNSVEIDISSKSAGIYFVRVKTEKKIMTEKVLRVK